MDQEVLGTVLQREESDRRVAHIRNVITKPGLPKGENYMSIITKLEVEVVLGSGRSSRRALILKSVPEGEQKIRMIRELGIFKQEIMMYTVILKEMEYLMEEFQDPHGPIWCNLVHYEPYSYLLMQDLQGEGYRVMPRKDCLDLNHAKLALRNIARFHAMSKVLETRGVIHSTDFKPYAFIEDRKILEYLIHKSLLTLRNTIIDSWGSDWSKVADRVNIPLETLVEKMKKIGEVKESRFNVLNHGDCWSNNMLFKHDPDGRPIAHRLIDFQVSYYNSFCWDIVYFLHSCVQPQVRRDNYNLLLDVYYKSLLSTLSRYNYAGRIPEMSELHSEMDRIALFRLTIVMIHAVITADMTDAFDLEEALASEGKKGHNPVIYQSKKFRDTIGPDLMELVKKGII